MFLCVIAFHRICSVCGIWGSESGSHSEFSFLLSLKEHAMLTGDLLVLIRRVRKVEVMGRRPELSNLVTFIWLKPVNKKLHRKIMAVQKRSLSNFLVVYG